MADDDHSTVDFVLTPRTTPADDIEDRKLHGIDVRPAPTFPRPGGTYIIRDAENHRELSLFDGKIRLLPSNILGAAIHWNCQEYRGWLGFKNLASGQFLGYDVDESLRTMPHHEGCESFCVRMVSKGFVLLMMEDMDKPWQELKPLKRKQMDDGVQVLEKVKAPASEGLAWEFEEIAV